MDVHRHHPDLAGVIALQVHHCANTPGITHIHTQAQGLLVQHVQQIDFDVQGCIYLGFRV